VIAHKRSGGAQKCGSSLGAARDGEDHKKKKLPGGGKEGGGNSLRRSQAKRNRSGELLLVFIKLKGGQDYTSQTGLRGALKEASFWWFIPLGSSV